jgi:hypothetical protein
VNLPFRCTPKAFCPSARPRSCRQFRGGSLPTSSPAAASLAITVLTSWRKTSLMVAVSITSPISNLAITGRLDLLRSQFSQVLVPRKPSEPNWSECPTRRPRPQSRMLSAMVGYCVGFLAAVGPRQLCSRLLHNWLRLGDSPHSKQATLASRVAPHRPRCGQSPIRSGSQKDFIPVLGGDELGQVLRVRSANDHLVGSGSEGKSLRGYQNVDVERF